MLLNKKSQQEERFNLLPKAIEFGSNDAKEDFLNFLFHCGIPFEKLEPGFKELANDQYPFSKTVMCKKTGLVEYCGDFPTKFNHSDAWSQYPETNLTRTSNVGNVKLFTIQELIANGVFHSFGRYFTEKPKPIIPQLVRDRIYEFMEGYDESETTGVMNLIKKY